MSAPYNSNRAPQFPLIAAKTYAAHPVWSNSAREEIKFAPMPKREAVRIYHHARHFARQTRRPIANAGGFVRVREGTIKRSTLAVLHALLFDFLNYKTGRLDPSYQAIAEKAGVSVCTVWRALVALRDCGVLSWVRRCRESYEDRRYILEQETNAYGVAPASQWRGYRQPPPDPGPAPGTWGKTPPLTSLGVEAGTMPSLQQLEAHPPDSLAGALARLSRRRSDRR